MDDIVDRAFFGPQLLVVALIDDGGLEHEIRRVGKRRRNLVERKVFGLFDNLPEPQRRIALRRYQKFAGPFSSIILDRLEGNESENACVPAGST
jgi:hypothetical protein